MWGALASSLEATGRIHEAIKCLKRVLLSMDPEPPEYGKCAQLFARLHQEDPNAKNESSAVFYYRKYLYEHLKMSEVVRCSSNNQQSNGEYVDEANAFLYDYHRKRGETSEASKYSE
jgi:hypothetical protein